MKTNNLDDFDDIFRSMEENENIPQETLVKEDFNNLTADEIFAKCRDKHLGEDIFQLAVDKGLLEGLWSDEILLLASEGGSLKYVKQAVEHGADIELVGYNYSPLISASKYGHFKVVKYLVEYGADLYAAGKSGWNPPLHCACVFGWIDIVQFFIEYGVNIDFFNSMKHTPLIESIHSRQFKIAEYLIKQGANVNKIPGRNDLSGPLWFAYRYGSFETVRLLVEYGAVVDPDIEKQGNCEIVKYLKSVKMF